MVLSPAPDRADLANGTATWELRIDGRRTSRSGWRSAAGLGRRARPARAARARRHRRSAGSTPGDRAYRPSPPSTHACPLPSTRRSPTSPRCASSTGPPRPRGRGRRRAVVHDPVRSGLAAHVVDGAAVRRRRWPQACCDAWPISRDRRTIRRPRSSRAGSCTSCAGTAAAGPFASRSRYYGTVDATPLFVMLVARGRTGGAPSTTTPVDRSRPLSTPPSAGSSTPATATATGSSTTGARPARARATRAGRTPGTASPSPTAAAARAPIALVEVQGYAYARAARRSGAAPSHVDIGHGADELRERAAEALRQPLQRALLGPSAAGSSLGLDGDGRRIDALTTQPRPRAVDGHRRPRPAHAVRSTG